MSRNNHTTDSKRYFDWLFHANLDLLTVGKLITDVRCFNNAAFHCQQSIEKALKGYLLFHTKKLYDGHNLTWLCKQAVLVDRHFKDYINDCASLSRYYIETRYPADIPIDIDTDTIQQLYYTCTEILEYICSEIRFEFTRYRKRKREEIIK